MKKIILFFLIACSTAFGQGIKKGKDGNYYADTTSKAAEKSAKATGKFFFDSKGQKWPVYESKNGKLFALRTSKSGTQYKQYLKID